MLGAARRALARVNRWIEAVLVPLCGLTIAAMLVVVCLTVAARLTGLSAPWTEKLILVLLPALAFLAAPVAYRRRANVALVMLPDALPPRAAMVLRLGVHLAVALILAIGLDLTLRKVGIDPGAWGRGLSALTGIDLTGIRPFRAPIKIPVLNIEWRWVYMVMPVMLSLTLLMVLEQILGTLDHLIAPTRAAPLPRRGGDTPAQGTPPPQGLGE